MRRKTDRTAGPHKRLPQRDEKTQRGQPPKIHRYAHFHSHADFSQKRATLTACLKKLQKMASDPIALKTSAVQKLAEFARLKYPSKLLWTACTTMGVNTRDPTWFRVREKIPSA